MKVCVCLTFIAAVLFLQVAESAVLQHDQIDLETAVRLLLKNVQRVMPCGFEKLNIPILAPVYLKHYKFNASDSIFNTTGYVSNLYVNGLNDVKILALNSDNATNLVSIDILFKNIQILAEYKMNNRVSLSGFPVEFGGEGVINNKFEDLRFVGDFRLSHALRNSSGLKIANFNLRFYLGNAVVNNFNHHWDNALNNFVNTFVSAGISTWAQQVQKRIDDYVTDIFLPITNEYLAKVSHKAALLKLLDLIVLLETVNCPKV